MIKPEVNSKKETFFPTPTHIMHVKTESGQHLQVEISEVQFESLKNQHDASGVLTLQGKLPNLEVKVVVQKHIYIGFSPTELISLLKESGNDSSLMLLDNGVKGELQLPLIIYSALIHSEN